MRSRYRLISLLLFYGWKNNNNKTFKNLNSEESVKHFILPIQFKQTAFAVSRTSVTVLFSAILSFKDMNH